jgi:hypothetical protein
MDQLNPAPISLPDSKLTEIENARDRIKRSPLCNYLNEKKMQNETAPGPRTT